MDFLIMNGDRVAAKWVDGQLEVTDCKMLPLYLENTGNVEKWLEMRAIDSHRANSRLLKKALRLSQRDDVSSVLAVNAVTITDNYWIKPLDSDLTYNDVRFDNDYFALIALNGDYDSFTKASNGKNSRTPELTNTGSFEKCWRLIDGKWQMYKKANREEMFSELFICKLGMKLGFYMAEYDRGKGLVKTKDFTDNGKVIFEPAFGFMGENEDYIETLEEIKKLCESAVGDYVKMLFLDAICANPDRHTFNFGILRDARSGEIISLAPNFDNNMALISRGYPKNIKRKNDLLIELFNELMRYDESLKKHIPSLTEEIVSDTIKEVGMKVRGKEITTFIMNGYNMIER